MARGGGLHSPVPLQRSPDAQGRAHPWGSITRAGQMGSLGADPGHGLCPGPPPHPARVPWPRSQPSCVQGSGQVVGAQCRQDTVPGLRLAWRGELTGSVSPAGRKRSWEIAGLPHSPPQTCKSSPCSWTEEVAPQAAAVLCPGMTNTSSPPCLRTALSWQDAGQGPPQPGHPHCLPSPRGPACCPSPLCVAQLFARQEAVAPCVLCLASSQSNNGALPRRPEAPAAADSSWGAQGAGITPCPPLSRLPGPQPTAHGASAGGGCKSTAGRTHPWGSPGKGMSDTSSGAQPWRPDLALASPLASPALWQIPGPFPCYSHPSFPPHAGAAAPTA